MAKKFGMDNVGAREVAAMIAAYNFGMRFDYNDHDCATAMYIVSEKRPDTNSIKIPEGWYIDTDCDHNYFVACDDKKCDARKIYFLKPDGKNNWRIFEP